MPLLVAISAIVPCRTLLALCRCSDALNANDISALAALHPVVSSNGELQTLVAADKSFALLQLGRRESSSFEPASPVVALKGSDVSLIPLHI